MKVGDWLYYVGWSEETRPWMQVWIVTSIMRRPQRRSNISWFVPVKKGTGEKTVYLRWHLPPKWSSLRSHHDTFALSRWPHNTVYCASELAAWRRALPLIQAEVVRAEAGLAESVAEGDEISVKEWKASLRQLRANRTIIERNAR